jgi:hypothetical protein
MKTAAISRALRPLAAALALAVLALTSGCVALVIGAAAGAGATVAYTRGTLEAWVDGGFNQTLAATNKAVQQLGFTKVGEEADGASTTVTARTQADKKVEITLGRGGERLTEVKIRVGLLGDKELSQALLGKIKEAL